MLASIRLFYPRSPVVLLSDHGSVDYTDVCDALDCKYVWADENINVGTGRPPHTYSCAKQMERIVQAIIDTGVPHYFFLWEADTRAMRPLLQTPQDKYMMQQAG